MEGKFVFANVFVVSSGLLIFGRLWRTSLQVPILRTVTCGTCKWKQQRVNDWVGRGSLVCFTVSAFRKVLLPSISLRSKTTTPFAIPHSHASGRSRLARLSYTNVRFKSFHGLLVWTQNGVLCILTRWQWMRKVKAMKCSRRQSVLS